MNESVLGCANIIAKRHRSEPYTTPPMKWNKRTRLKDIVAHLNNNRQEYVMVPVKRDKWGK